MQINASLNITVSYKNEVSFLADNYYTPPFKIANITEKSKENLLELAIMNSSPGVLDGDNYNIQITVEENAKLRLHTQSYQRIFNMQIGANQHTQIHIKENASLIYIPHPIVPHYNAIFTTQNIIKMTKNASLIWGEILTSGRNLHDEYFLYKKYKSLTKIFIEEKLILHENLVLEPALRSVQQIGQLEGFTHQAGLIFVGNKLNIIETAAKLYDYLLTIDNIEFGISQLQAGQGLIIRMLGYKAEILYNCMLHLHNIIID